MKKRWKMMMLMMTRINKLQSVGARFLNDKLYWCINKEHSRYTIDSCLPMVILCTPCFFSYNKGEGGGGERTPENTRTTFVT
jgi:hypothetical protein